MYELSENPAENSKRHLRALPGIPDMWGGLGIIQLHHTCPVPIWPPIQPPIPPALQEKLWAATYSPFAPSQGASLHTALQALCQEDMPHHIFNPPRRLRANRRKNQRAEEAEAAFLRAGCGHHDCRIRQELQVLLRTQVAISFPATRQPHVFLCSDLGV